MDASIIIVQHNTPRLLRQTLKGIRRAAPSVSYEVILSENDPGKSGIAVARGEFPEVRVVDNGANVGFGIGMNNGMAAAAGRYIFVFNPDILLTPGSLDELVRFLDEHPDVGLVAPQLKNPDGSLQHSCYRFMEPKTVLYRRLPFLKSLPQAKKHVDEYLMADWDHADTRDVDYVLGAAMLVRREALDQVGAFDPEFFVYFEDQDLCRRFWKAGQRVVYHPASQMIHYHRRETAEGGFFRQLTHPLTRIQIKSAIYYFRKYRGEGNPREKVQD
jgi:hypothetical protein